MSSWITATVAAIITAAARATGVRAQRRSYWRLVCLVCGFVLAVVAGPASAQRAYPTPEAAAAAMIDAVKREDSAALNNILGANWKKFIPTQDPEDIDAFLAEWDKSNRIEMFAPGAGRIAVGDGNWELPIPIVHVANGWRFDVRAGADEMETRRIGRNELAAMQAALAYFDAQQDYARVDRMNDGVLQYAQRFISAPGKHDGLYWPTSDSEEDSPLGPLFADTSKKIGEGYHGYRFKILTAQGADAPGGAYSYLIDKRMVSGFALVAWPLQYGDSGVMSFMISHDGQLYEKNLGANSAAIAQAMTVFNPDASWRKVAAPDTAK